MTMSLSIDEIALADIDRLRECITRSYRVGGDVAGGKRWKHETTFAFAGGRRVTLDDPGPRQLLFPASPGCEALNFARPQDSDPATYDIATHITRRAVIAWDLESEDGYEMVTAITTSGTEWRAPADFSALIFPHGRVAWRGPYTATGVGHLASLEAWIELVREVWAGQIKSEAEQARRYDRSHDDEIPF